MAKHEEHEEHENHERWLVSYADFITLLFAFFVVMYAISQVDQKRAITVENSLKWALHIAGHGGGGDRILTPDGSMPGARAMDVIPMQREQRDKSTFEAAKSRISRKASMAGAGEARPSVLVMLERRHMIVRVSALQLFDEGNAALRPAALPTLDAVLSEVGSLRRGVRVEGHTDSNTTTQDVFDKNWTLSAERAAAVVSYAQAARLVDPSLLSLAGYGARKPVASNDTVEGRAKNRRIDIVVDLSEEVGDAPSPALLSP